MPPILSASKMDSGMYWMCACEAFGEPILSQPNQWTKSIWEAELARRKENLNAEEEKCNENKLTSDSLANCANKFGEALREQDEQMQNENEFEQDVAKLYEDLTHPLNWTPDLLDPRLNFSWGMGDPLKTTPPEVQESFVYVQLVLEW